jgi:hypothetical protein
MPESRTFLTAMRIDAGVPAELDLELDGYYHPPSRGHPDLLPDDSRYLIFRARARTLLSRPVLDPATNIIVREPTAGRWVDLPLALFTGDQLRRLEAQAAHAFVASDVDAG